MQELPDIKAADDVNGKIIQVYARGWLWWIKLAIYAAFLGAFTAGIIISLLDAKFFYLILSIPLTLVCVYLVLGLLRHRVKQEDGKITVYSTSIFNILCLQYNTEIYLAEVTAVRIDYLHNDSKNRRETAEGRYRATQVGLNYLCLKMKNGRVNRILLNHFSTKAQKRIFRLVKERTGLEVPYQQRSLKHKYKTGD